MRNVSKRRQHQTPWASRRVLSAGVALFLLLLGWYMLTMSGHTYSSDEETMLAAGESLASTGWFNIPRSELFLMNRNRGVDGLSYSRYGPGQSVAAAPFILGGRAIGLSAPRYTGYIVRIVALLLPALATAATALTLYAWVREVGFDTQAALPVGLLYGLTSIAWPFSRTFFAEPLATFFLVLCAYGLRRVDRRWWAIAGAAAACALATKIQTALALPVIGIYALLAAVPDQGHVAAQPAHPSFWGTAAGRLIFGLLGAALPLGLLLLYNWRLFGSPLSTGYGGVGADALVQGGNWREGLYGLTISTGKGLLIFAPTVLLGLAGMFFSVRRQWRETLLALGLLVTHLAFYSQVEYWHGDGSWGPRYMLFVTPFLYLPAAGVLTRLRRPTTDERRTTSDERRRTNDERRRTNDQGRTTNDEQRTTSERGAVRGRWSVVSRQWSVVVLAILGFAIQLLPVLLNFNVYLQVSRPGARYFEPSASPIVGHARMWQARVETWWWRVAGAPPGTALLRQGFSYSEGDRSRGELLPRWSYTEGQIRLYPATSGPIAGRIVVGDHRPWPLPRAQFALLLDGAPLEGVQRTDLDGNQVRWELAFTLAPEQVRRGASLELRSDTWNPDRDTPDNPRNEDLGLLVETIELHQGDQALRLREALPIPPPQLNRRGLWLWTQDAPNQHLFDVWLWYLAVSGAPPLTVALLLGLVALPALLILAAGLRGVIQVFHSP